MRKYLVPAAIAFVAFILGLSIGAAGAPAPTTQASAPASSTYVAPEVPPQLPASAYYTEPTVPVVGPVTPAAPSYPLTTVTEGTYLVGSEITAGRWVTDGADYCYYARLRNLDGTLSGIIANGNTSGHTTIAVSPKDAALEVKGTCAFHKVG